jgi:MFS family permease
MEKPQNLLVSRRFLPMFLTQFFGALNDNVYKQSLLLVITYGLIQHSSGNISTLNNLAALLFISPYFVFSATAGQIADKFERAQLVRGIKVLEIIIMSIGSAGFMLGQIWLLLLALFLMGVHSTFLVQSNTPFCLKFCIPMNSCQAMPCFKQEHLLPFYLA